ncbi:MAG TPA: hypothetical protein VIH57_06585 [Bacteroidales bacterium]
MAKEKDLIIPEIEKFKNEYGGNYSDYYIGITKHIGQRLVEETLFEHQQKGEYTEGNPTYKTECNNRDEAVEIERYFQGKGMLMFNPRSFGIEDSRFIYCFKMTKENKENILLENSVEGKKMRKKLKDYKDFINGK